MRQRATGALLFKLPQNYFSNSFSPNLWYPDGFRAFLIRGGGGWGVPAGLLAGAPVPGVGGASSDGGTHQHLVRFAQVDVELWLQSGERRLSGVPGAQLGAPQHAAACLVPLGHLARELEHRRADRPAKSGGGPATRLPSGVRLRGRTVLSRYCVALVWAAEAKKARCATASPS